MPRRHQPQKPVRYTSHESCRQKRRFASEKLALAALEQQSVTMDVEIRVYQCPYCNGWHLTSNK